MTRFQIPLPNRQTKTTMWVLLLLVGAFGTTPHGAADAPAAASEEDGPCTGGTGLDVLFLFDTTGSMGGVISDAQNGASQVMANVAAAHPGTAFGVANYRDYEGAYSYPGYSATYGGSGDYPWSLDQAFTTDTSLAQSAIDTLSASGGADWPESLTRALYESRQLSWAADHRIVVLFADAPPHDLDFDGQNTGGDPGPDGVAGTSDDLDFETEVQAAAGNDVQLAVVDSGGGSSAAYFEYMADQTDGGYALLSGDFVDIVTDLILDLAPDLQAHATATALRAELAVPVNPLVEVAPVSARGNPEVRYSHVHRENVAALDGALALADDGAQTGGGEDGRTARSNATVAWFSLLGGLLEGGALHAEASSATDDGGTVWDTSASRIGWVEIAGERFEAPIAPNTVVPIPGVGVAILNERRAHEDGAWSEADATAVHLILDTPQLRGDIRVAHAYAATACGADVGILRETVDNDAGLGRDAGDTAAEAEVVGAPALFQGRLQDGDPADHYAVPAAEGQKVQAYLMPSSRAHVTIGHEGSLSSSERLPDLRLTLHEPGSFVQRESSDLPASAPEKVELNVDEDGDWVVKVARSPRAPHVQGNYTIALVVSDILLADQNDAGQPGDAPDTCAAPRAVTPGAYTGVLRDDDHVDHYSVKAETGDALAIAVKPAEDVDGADFDLELYDEACILIASSALGKDLFFEGLVPKGVPDAVALAPAVTTQTYHFAVVRHNGVGNYYLDVTAQDPQPTLGAIDAEGQGDAGDGRATATTVDTPGAYQGRMPDGDQTDWYSFKAIAGERIHATLEPSALSDFDLHLVRPDGTTAVSSTGGPFGAPETIDFIADDSGSWYLHVERKDAGGDYLFTVLTAPS